MIDTWPGMVIVDGNSDTSSTDIDMLENLRGQFLVAVPRMRDPNFFKTVVLIVEHGSEGAMGLVVNRPSTLTVSDTLAGEIDLPDTEDLVFCGGPVEPSALFILHSDDEVDSSETAESEVVSGVYIGGSRDTFEKVVRHGYNYQSDRPFRIFMGCAGWGTGQLESEIQRGDWLVCPANASTVFREDPYGNWDQLLQEIHRVHRLFPHPIENPEWN